MTAQFRLGEAVSRDVVEAACADLGLRLSNVVPKTETHPAQWIFVTRDKVTMVHLMEDPGFGKALVVRGERESELSQALLAELGVPTAGNTAKSDTPQQHPEGTAK
ncbi:MAG: hypothetical protein IPK82_13335 [Polyangiaceae bacterium]|nr:hypothetical protein [Polyangiaceae bacterium]